MFDRLAETIIRHPKKIVVLWVAILAISIGVILTTDSNLKYDMTTMSGSEAESTQGMDIIADEFYSSGQNSSGIIIATEYDATRPETEAAFYAALSSGLISKYSGEVGLNRMFNDPSAGIAIYTIVYPNAMKGTDMVPEIRDIIRSIGSGGNVDMNGMTTYVTGSDAISYDTQAGAMKDIMRIDPISILLILILIGLFFRSFVASPTPPLVVGAAYGIVTCLIYFLGGIMDIFYITPILLLVSMLGAGCDYCIFIISRFREERKQGRSKEDSLRESVKWAGESISTSGMSVIIGFGVMAFCSFSLVSTMGIVLALGIVVALIAALTLIPSILMIAGDRIFYPSTMESYTEGSKAMNGWYGNWSRRGQRYFSGSARHAIKYAKPIVLAAVLVTVPLAYVTFTEETSYDMISTMPPGEAKDGVDLIVDNVGGGAMMPTYEVVRFDTPLGTVDHGNRTITWRDDIDTYTALLDDMDSSMSELENVQYTISLSTFLAAEPVVRAILSGIGQDAAVALIMLIPGMDAETAMEIYRAAADIASSMAEAGVTAGIPKEGYNYFAYTAGLVSYDASYTKTTVIMKDEPMSALAMDTIDGIRVTMSQIASTSGGLIAGSWTTGGVATTYDISGIVSDEFTWIEIGVIILIFLLLFFVLRSYLTPIRAIVTILMSIAWTLGLTHIIFGWILGMDIIWLIPIILLVVCLGLGMDYDILLTTRIRENRLKGMSNDEAITHAVEKSGVVITLCGLIMSGTFFTLLLSSSPMLMQFGFALGFAILVDALVVRTYIVPSIMHLLGDWNWKGPSWLQRGKHRIEFEKKE